MEHVVFCAYCGEPIPEEIMKRRRKNSAQHFCDRPHGVAWDKENGRFAVMGKAGNAAQASYKRREGHIPQYEKRVAALRESNMLHPRRRRKA